MNDNGWGLDDGGWDAAPKKIITENAHITTKVVNSRAEKMFVKNEQRHYLAAKELADLCVEPAEGEQWRILTEKSIQCLCVYLPLTRKRKY